jgi:hypothetical protein
MRVLRCDLLPRRVTLRLDDRSHHLVVDAKRLSAPVWSRLDRPRSAKQRDPSVHRRDPYPEQLGRLLPGVAAPHLAEFHHPLSDFGRIRCASMHPGTRSESHDHVNRRPL